MEDKYTKRGIPEVSYEEAKVIVRNAGKIPPKFDKLGFLKFLVVAVPYVSIGPIVDPFSAVSYFPLAVISLIMGHNYYSNLSRRKAINDGTFFKDRTDEQVVHFAKQLLLGNPKLLESFKAGDMEEIDHVKGR